jgi:hypothetical protein
MHCLPEVLLCDGWLAPTTDFKRVFQGRVNLGMYNFFNSSNSVQQPSWLSGIHGIWI